MLKKVYEITKIQKYFHNIAIFVKESITFALLLENL
jgi:hypothetical protein